MIRLNRNEYMSNESYLFHLYNDLGASNLRIAIANKNNDDIFWSKWISFEELMHKDQEEIVWNGLSKKEFIEKSNNRTILDIEVMLDFDEAPGFGKDKQAIKEFARQYLKLFWNKGFCFEAYTTGSKGIHVSLLFPELRNLNRSDRENFKKYFIKKHFADKIKYHDNCMIALEGSPHWKTGKIKEVFNYE